MTTETASPAVPKVHVSERAAKKILALLAKEGVSADQGGLRVGIQGGGCSGLSYAMHKWITELPGFSGDPSKSNESKLEAIQTAWHEEWEDRQG